MAHSPLDLTSSLPTGPAPLVSVIVCYLNGANFIEEAIGSVLAQDCSDWELVLVNDGSSDESPAIAARHAANDPRIRTLSHPDGRNHGVAAARKLGVDAARGRHIVFLDHDDVLRPWALSRMTGILEREAGVAMVFARTLYWAWDMTIGKEEMESSFAPFPPGRLAGQVMLRDLIRWDTRHPPPCSIALRRDVLLATRGDGALWHGMYEETALLMKILARHDVWLLDEVVSSYRMHPDSMCIKAEAAGTLSNETVSRDRVRYIGWAARHVAMDWRSRLLALTVWLKGEAKLRLAPRR